MEKLKPSPIKILICENLCPSVAKKNYFAIFFFAVSGRNSKISPGWQSSVCGAFPSVPDYLSGMPENMRRRTHNPDESTLIRIFYCTSGYDSLNRSCAALALAIALSNTRPVELYAFDVKGQ